MYFVGFDTEKPFSIFCNKYMCRLLRTIGTSGWVLASLFMQLFQVMGRSCPLCLALENHISSCKKYMSKSETLSSEGLHLNSGLR